MTHAGLRSRRDSFPVGICMPIAPSSWQTSVKLNVKLMFAKSNFQLMQVHDDNWLRDVAPLPLHAVLPLVRDGLQAFAPGLSSSRAAAACADSNTRQLLLCSLACLFSEDASQSQAALKGLLPAAIGSARRLGGGLRRLAVAAVWDCARYTSLHVDPGRVSSAWHDPHTLLQAPII